MIDMLKSLALKAANAVLAGLMHIGKFSKSIATAVVGGVEGIVSGVCKAGSVMLDNPALLAAMIVAAVVAMTLVSCKRSTTTYDQPVEIRWYKTTSDSTHGIDDTNVSPGVKRAMGNIEYVIKSVKNMRWDIYGAISAIKWVL